MPGPKNVVIGIVCGYESVTRLKLLGSFEIEVSILDTDGGIDKRSGLDNGRCVVSLLKNSGVIHGSDRFL